MIDRIRLKDKYTGSVDISRNIMLLDKFIENDIFSVLFDNKLMLEINNGGATSGTVNK